MRQAPIGWQRLRPYRQMAAEILTVGSVLAILAASVLGLNFWLTDASRSATDATDIGRTDGKLRLTKISYICTISTVSPLSFSVAGLARPPRLASLFLGTPHGNECLY